MKRLKDEDGNEYELIKRSAFSDEYVLKLVEPIQPIESSYTTSMNMYNDRHGHDIRTIHIEMEGVSQEQVKVLDEAIRALLEYVQTPYSSKVPSLNTQARFGNTYVMEVEAAREAVQGGSNG